MTVTERKGTVVRRLLSLVELRRIRLFVWIQPDPADRLSVHNLPLNPTLRVPLFGSFDALASRS